MASGSKPIKHKKPLLAAWALIYQHPMLKSLTSHVRLYVIEDAPHKFKQEIHDRLKSGNNLLVISRASRSIFVRQNNGYTEKELCYALARVLLYFGLGYADKMHKDNDHETETAIAWLTDDFLRKSKIFYTPAPEWEFLPPHGTDLHEVKRQLHGTDFSAHLLNPGGEWLQEQATGYTAEETHRLLHKPDWAKIMGAAIREYLAAALKPIKNLNQMGPGHVALRTLKGRYPLLASLAAGMTIHEDSDLVRHQEIATAVVFYATREIHLNTVSMSSLSSENWVFIIAHELLHPGLRHDQRCGNRDKFLWNLACDYAVNRFLVDMKVGIMPAFSLYSEGFGTRSAEEIYDIMAQDARRYRKLQTLAGKGKCDWIGEYTGETASTEYYRRAMIDGYHRHQQGRGTLPAGLEAEIHALSVPPIPWDVALGQWLHDFLLNPERRRTYARPSRRQEAAPDIPLAGWRTPKDLPQQTFAAIIDTSGSMFRTQLAQALGAIYSYAEAKQVETIRLISCDAQPYDHGWVPLTALTNSFTLKGRGGTTLQPAVDLLQTSGSLPPRTPLLIITDGAIEKYLHITIPHAFLLLGPSLNCSTKAPVFTVK